MQITKNNNHKTRNIIALSTLVVALAMGGFYAYSKYSDVNTTDQQSGSTNKVNYDKATKEQQDAGSTIKKDSVTGGSDNQVPPTAPGNTKKNIQVTITAANQNGSTLQIRALISAVEDTGTCTLTLTQPGKTAVTKTASTQALASASTCKGFDVPTSELSTGTWQALINYDSPALIGSATKTITLQ